MTLKEGNKAAVLGFYGYSGVGKTYLFTNIVERLVKADFKLAVVKISDKSFSMDTEGKDTFLYGVAGAQTVVLSTMSETAFLYKDKLTSKQMVEKLQADGSYDFIFIEGALEDWIPKVRLGDITERKNTLFTYSGEEDMLYDWIIEMIERRKKCQI